MKPSNQKASFYETIRSESCFYKNSQSESRFYETIQSESSFIKPSNQKALFMKTTNKEAAFIKTRFPLYLYGSLYIPIVLDIPGVFYTRRNVFVCLKSSKIIEAANKLNVQQLID